MLHSSHSQNIYDYPSSSSGTNIYSSGSHGSLLSYSSSAGLAAMGPSPMNSDPNAPEMFNQNIKIAMQYVEIISRLAKSTVDGIENAFNPTPESNPMSTSANLASLRQYVEMFATHLVSTGVGALPIIQLPVDGSAPTPPCQSSILEEATKTISVLYARQRQIQENHTVVANLLSAPEGSRR